MQNELRIVFMGTPEFAVPSLDVLIQNNYHVVAVITAPDKPAGRGQTLQSSAIKKYANAHDIPVLQPTKLKDPDFIESLKSYNANLQIVVAFRMLPEVIWAMPALGTFNLHASLLPDYRGAAPINRAVMNGENKTGITTFFLQHEIDTGNIIFQSELSIGPDESAGELHDRMMIAGGDLVLKTVQAIASGTVHTYPQVLNSDPKFAPKIFKEDCKFSFDFNLEQAHNFIRGLSPVPGAWTSLDGKIFKLFKSQKEYATVKEPIGTFIKSDPNTLKLSLKDGYLHILEVQLEGKKRMAITEFLKGYQF